VKLGKDTTRNGEGESTRWGGGAGGLHLSEVEGGWGGENRLNRGINEDIVTNLLDRTQYQATKRADKREICVGWRVGTYMKWRRHKTVNAGSRDEMGKKA